MFECKVVIPIHTNKLSDYEYLSIKNNIALLKQHPIVFLIPENFTINPIIEKISDPSMTLKYETVAVSEDFLGPKNGIAGYNSLMLSLEFYELFSDCKYILVCQPDAWIFRDELSEWCRKDYDYIGGIWWRKGIWALPIIRSFFPANRRLYGKVGNGGLSLRRIDSFKKACVDYKERINFYKEQTHHMYSEDVFWAIEPKEFKYPSMIEATMFAFDNHPDRCLKLTEGKLPFGSHGWLKQSRIEFWKPYILNESNR